MSEQSIKSKISSFFTSIFMRKTAKTKPVGKPNRGMFAAMAESIREKEEFIGHKRLSVELSSKHKDFTKDINEYREDNNDCREQISNTTSGSEPRKPVDMWIRFLDGRPDGLRMAIFESQCVIIFGSREDLPAVYATEAAERPGVLILLDDHRDEPLAESDKDGESYSSFSRKGSALDSTYLKDILDRAGSMPKWQEFIILTTWNNAFNGSYRGELVRRLIDSTSESGSVILKHHVPEGSKDVKCRSPYVNCDEFNSRFIDSFLTELETVEPYLRLGLF